MSWPKDPFITDSAYKTPLPCQPCERQVWRIVAGLYEYDTLAALMKLNDNAVQSATLPSSSVPRSRSADPSAAAACVSSPVRSPRSTTTRAEAVERRSAFLAAATSSATTAGNVADISPTSSNTASSGATQRATTDTPSTSPTAGSGGAGPARPTTPSVTAVPSTVSHSQPLSPYVVRGASGSWGTNGSLTGTTGFIRATSLRALEPLQTLLIDLAAKKRVMGAGVVDVAVQHPLPCLRIELVRVLLAYPFWEWSMCAPVAVAAGLGDIDVLQLLVAVEALDPNTGFPLTVAVRRRQEETVLSFLLAHHRIRPNYGGAFYAAVVVGNVPAMHLLGDAANVNINRFSNNEGTSALLYALRQYLLCHRAEARQVNLSPPSPTPALHAAKPHQSVSSPTQVTPADMSEGEEISATPLLVVHSDGQQQRDHPLLTSGAAATAMAGAGTRVAEVRSEAPTADDATLTPRTVLRLPADETHSAAFRRDTTERPLRTARHWREVLLYLLDHPAIEVNAGFYMTPLQICVLAANAEVVSWLLQHPHLRPCRLPKATTVLCNSYYLLQHHALSQPAMQCVVSTPIEMAARLRNLDIFRQLARDQRIQIPVRLTMDLERSAAEGEVIPYLTALAQCRGEWEGWGWRWRRRCTAVAAIATTVFAVCFWLMVCMWSSTLHGGLLVLMGTYAITTVISLGFFLWQAEALRHSPDTSLTRGSTVVLALIRHLCPSWSSTQLRMAVAVLLLCPGCLPLLDVLCAWHISHVCRSRHRLQTADAAAMAASSHAVTPTAGDAAAQPPGNAQRQRQHHYHHHHHHGTDEPPLELERLSSTTSWGWSVGLSNGSDLSANSSVSEVPRGGYGGGSGNDSFSRPRPAVARTRRQSNARAAAAAAAGGDGNSVAGAVSIPLHGDAETERHNTSTSSPPNRRQLSFAGASLSATAGVRADSSNAMSPSLCTSRHRSPWVVPGRPSRYTLKTEYTAPDLLLRALAYTAYDTVLVLPRLLTCVVGIFMFMYMVFPSAAPSSSSSSSLALSGAALADAVRGHSSFTLYYGAKQPAVAVVNNITGAAAAAASAVSASSTPELPTYSIAIGVVGLCGLLSSILGGAALLAMIGSLRTVTVQAFLTSPGGKADARDGGGRVERRVGESSSWHAAHNRAREAEPNYAL